MVRTQKEKSRERDRGRYKDREYARDMRIVRLAFRHSEKEWEEGAQKWSEDHKVGNLPLKAASGFRGAWLRNGMGERGSGGNRSMRGRVPPRLL